ncbi:MAG: glycosyltransferase family 2 protein [archaeon]
MKGYSIVIPVYNEEEIIKKNTLALCKYLNKLQTPYEIIIVSNGSNDNTNALGIGLRRKNKQVKFYFIPEKGVGKAFKYGVGKAKYSLIISVDMDLSIDLEFINRSAKLLKNYDLIIGSKKDHQKRPFYRILISSAYIYLVKLLFNFDYKDYSIAAKAYKKEIIKKSINYLSDGTSYVFELIYYATREKKKIREIDVYCLDNRKSKFNLIIESKERLIELLSLYLKNLNRTS